MSQTACPTMVGRAKAQEMPSLETDTIIVGNGPSAMILSYILHGHLPFYSSNPPHPDPLLHAKLQDFPELLHVDVHALTDHFAASRLSYSTQALPVNVLLDTLVRPSVDVEELEAITNVEWRFVPEKAVPHLVFGNAQHAGGQWTDNPVPASWDIQTLSYASMLSLPGYSFAEHHRKITGKELPAYTRPSREETASYFRTYPEAVQIDDVFRFNETISGISRTDDGFYIHSHNIHCKHLVLASGIFTQVLQPSPMLQPLASLQPTSQTPLLVIGSGFSAADIIISAPADQKIIHVFKWDPEGRSSPLRGCHHQAYPEYAGVYRLMKRAAVAADPTKKRVKPRRTTSIPFLETRSWEDIYEGLPNSEVLDVEMQEGQALVTFRQPDGSTITRAVRGMVYATGRRGTLDYLDRPLLNEVLDQDATTETSPVISARSLRSKVYEDIEIAPDVFVIGSLTGDSLIRFAYGSCVQAAGKLVDARTGKERVRSGSNNTSRPQSSLGVMRGIDGHDISPPSEFRAVDNDRMASTWPQRVMPNGLWRWLWRWFDVR
ncbi:uncharacterized protein BO88DRAFT_9034 [Aspergillus vadensis CBS 113365]|uniref:FAD/NAD(P)-binding domain-containing protein n=1 Tax=Aspergillus vadensis (strain CBS 113365 / IMI 142717 / IBT 24658) TaxID=1448311 RepID=A0A319C7F4_ASPVC|nr:hypothetical protein BO88DRAFT_9034 [Aspergillus vadensis CBS 113365]PYH74363.1 hypothetical protein BO88DRAFT_9034 [Aspergillus vadensis CBS 113365]